METVSVVLAFCEGNQPVTGGFPSQRASNTDFDVFFDVTLNKELNKQSNRRWFEKPEWSLWRQTNGVEPMVNDTYGYVYNMDGFQATA